MDLETLYPLVTEAIRRAEVLEDLRAPGAVAANLDLSLIEERIAELLPAASPEGSVARRGAIRAALAAQDFSRAQVLASRFAKEPGLTAKLRAELRRLGHEANRATSERERSMATRFPRICRKYGVVEIRRLAQALIQQESPFPTG